MSLTRHRGGMRSPRILAVGAALALALSACAAPAPGNDADAEETPLTGKLVVAQTADTRSLFANSATAQPEINISEQITEKLIEFSADGKSFEPRLAEKWEQIDPVTLHLTLRDGVTFTNGEEFSAESAAFSLEIMRNAAAYASFTSAISDVQVVDESTVAVISDGPSDLIMASLAMGSFQYPKEYFEEVTQEGFATDPIGTGPFKLKEWKKGVRIDLVRNDDYWDGAPALEEIEFRIIPEKTAQVAALQAGEVDLVQDVVHGSRKQVDDADGIDLVTRPSSRIYYAFFNTLVDGPLQNPKVRQALQYAIDVEALIDGALGGYGTPLKGQVGMESMFGFDEKRKATPYDPEKARKLLAEAGYPDGFELPFEYSPGNFKEVGQAMASQLEDVGISVKQEMLEPGTALQNIITKEMKGLTYWGLLTPPDEHFVYQQFESNFRYSYYQNPVIDDLLARELASGDRDERKKIFIEMLDEFDKDPAYIPLFQSVDAYGVAQGVSGFEPRASQFIDLRTVKN